MTSMDDLQQTVNHSLRNTSNSSPQKLTKFSNRNQFLQRILHRSCSEDGNSETKRGQNCSETNRGRNRGAQECRSVGGSPRLVRCDPQSHWSFGKILRRRNKNKDVLGTSGYTLSYDNRCVNCVSCFRCCISNLEWLLWRWNECNFKKRPTVSLMVHEYIKSSRRS